MRLTAKYWLNNVAIWEVPSEETYAWAAESRADCVANGVEIGGLLDIEIESIALALAEEEVPF